jgi:hypothetical protein
MVEQDGGARWTIVEKPSVGPNEAFQQGLIRFDGTLEAHQVALYLSRNPNVGFALPCRQNCGRYGPIQKRGVACSGPSLGRVSIEIMFPKPCSNKRSDGWCATTISSSSAVRNPVAAGVSEPAFLGAVPNGVVFGAVGHRRSTLPLSPSLVFPEIRRAEIPYCIKSHDSSTSLLELVLGDGVKLR